MTLFNLVQIAYDTVAAAGQEWLREDVPAGMFLAVTELYSDMLGKRLSQRQAAAAA